MLCYIHIYLCWRKVVKGRNFNSVLCISALCVYNENYSLTASLRIGTESCINNYNINESISNWGNNDYI